MVSLLSDELAREVVKKYHSPLYVFEAGVIRRQCQILKSVITYPNSVIRYACKALTLQAILKIVLSEGIWIDASSLNEVKRALLAGAKPKQILYTGENCSELVFSELISLGVDINCSSLDQIRLLGQLAPQSALSVRFNPGEGHGANNKVNTGGPASKHGIYYTQLAEVKALINEYNLHLKGIHTHIGSGTDLNHWLRIKDLTFDLASQFNGLEFIDLGGGLPIVYNPSTDLPLDLKFWGAQLSASFAEFSAQYGTNLQLQVEPGRFLVAECGSLLAEIQNLKTTPSYNFAVVNTGFNHNIRPAMYGAWHPIRFISKDGRITQELVKEKYVIAGYLCESGDVFTIDSEGVLTPREFPHLELGDIMLMENVGAYSHAMKSEYNSMNLPASILLDEDASIKVIERRGTLEDIMRRELEVY